MPNAGDYVRASDTTRYYVKATQSSAQAIPNNSFTAITLNAGNDVDNLGIHDPVTNNSRLNVGLAIGFWLVGATYASAATGTTPYQQRLRLVMNGSTGVNGAYSVPTPVYTPGTSTITESGFYSIQTTSILQTTVSSDYVEMHAFQASGGSVNTTVSGDLRSSMWALYLGS